METSTGRRAWLVFYIDGQLYSIPVGCIEELLTDDAVQTVSLPGMNQGITGLVRWRNCIVPRLDLRTVLGMPTMSKLTDELIETLTQREADHVRWLEELEKSIREDAEFKLTTDPHKCAFGKWYDLVRSDDKHRDAFTNRSQGLLRVLNSFDKPHAAIHDIAQEIEELKKRGEYDQAHNLISKTRDGALKAMVKLFNDAREFIRRLHRSMTIILHHGNDRVCLVIDSIDLIVEQDDANLESVETGSSKTSLPMRVSRCGQHEDLVMHIEPGDLIGWYAAQNRAA